MTTLYEKKGRRYVVWGNVEAWNRDGDIMQAGTHRLVHCPADGERRYRNDVTPDSAAFIAAAQIAERAMEKAMLEKAKAQPNVGPRPYTAKQIALIDKFREDMAAEGALVPTYWVYGTAAEIAKAGLDAVINAQQSTTTKL